MIHGRLTNGINKFHDENCYTEATYKVITDKYQWHNPEFIWGRNRRRQMSIDTKNKEIAAETAMHIRKHWSKVWNTRSFHSVLCCEHNCTLFPAKFSCQQFFFQNRAQAPLPWIIKPWNTNQQVAGRKLTVAFHQRHHSAINVSTFKTHDRYFGKRGRD